MRRRSLPGRAPYSRFDAKWLVIGVVVALVAWLSLLPLGFLLWQSILTAADRERARAIHAAELSRRLFRL